MLAKLAEELTPRSLWGRVLTLLLCAALGFLVARGLGEGIAILIFTPVGIAHTWVGVRLWLNREQTDELNGIMSFVGKCLVAYILSTLVPGILTKVGF